MTSDLREIYVSELRGFLNALQQLCGNSSSFYADFFEVKGGAEESVNRYIKSLKNDFCLRGISEITYAEIKKIFNERIFLRLPLPQGEKELGGNLVWHLVEYYGLVSTSGNGRGSFNALSHEKTLRLSIECVDFLSCDCFVVVMGDFAVITVLAELTST